MTSRIFLLACCFMPLVLGGCSTLSAEPVAARVVDADTGEPLAGVVIMAYWDLHQGSLWGHAPSCGAADIEEAVTDGDGRFRIPGWGPVTTSCDMRSANPALLLFKSGYGPLGLNNNVRYSLETVSVSRSDWDGKTIELKKFHSNDLTRNDSTSYASAFGNLNSNVGRFITGACNWKKMPNMLRAIYLQQLQFEAAHHYIETVVTELLRNDKAMQQTEPECGSPKAFIEGLVK